MTTKVESAEAVIIGGGIAGLWLINRLAPLGYSTILISNGALGTGQTIASQGIVHGGLKYTINDMWGASARNTHLAKRRWQSCIEGGGEIDLRSVKVCSRSLFLWSAAHPYARLSLGLARYLYAGNIARVTPRHRPQIFHGLEDEMPLFQMDDWVVEIRSLLEALAAPHDSHVRHMPAHARLIRYRDGVAVRAEAGNGVQILVPKICVLAAGTGNEALLRAVGESAPRMRRRPLRQLVVRHAKLPEIYGHYLNGGSRPLFTVSTHEGRDGLRVWYVGGALAEDISKPRRESPLDVLARAFNRPELKKAELDCVEVERAEPDHLFVRRPGQPYLAASARAKNLFTAWPVKLTMVPFLADALLEKLSARNIAPKPGNADRALPDMVRDWHRLEPAIPPWQRC